MRKLIPILLLLAPLTACFDSDGSCIGDVEITCEEDGCTCGSGPNEGAECSEDVDTGNAESCTVVCCDSSDFGY